MRWDKQAFMGRRATTRLETTARLESGACFIAELISYLLINNLVNETGDVSACIKYSIKQYGT